MNPQDQPSGPPTDRHEFRPGQTISPRDGSSLPAEEAPAPQVNPAPLPGAEPSMRAPLEHAVPAQESLYHAEDTPGPALPDQALGVSTSIDTTMRDNGREVVWTAQEFIAHEKSPAWFMSMTGAAVAIALIIYIITRDVFNTVIVIIGAIIFGVAATRQPRQMQYAVDDHGISIGRRDYPYGDFRSFSIAEDGPFRSIVFMPLKRFMPQMSIYYDPADEDRIAEVLSSHLPVHEHRHDLTERLMRRIRF